MKKIQYLVLTLGFVASFMLAGVPLAANASNALSGACSGASSTLCDHQNDNIMTSVKSIVNTLLYVLGAIAVFMIIIAGFMYTLSGGNSSIVEKAKSMLLYSAVGVVVALLAYAIVNFVVSAF